MADSQPIYVRVDSTNPVLRQGEILSNVVQFKVTPGTVSTKDSDGNPVISGSILEHSLAVIVSQDCDLDVDSRARQRLLDPELTQNDIEKHSGKLLLNILFCEIELAKDLKRGLPPDDSSSWDRISKNNDFRFHLLEKVPAASDALDSGIETMTVIFKRYFCIPTEDLLARITIGETKRRCHMTSPYFEHLSSRFTHFMGRIGLPVDHKVK